MIEVLHKELSGLLSLRSEDVHSVCSSKSANDRVDGLTLLCRGVVRDSSLCYVGGVMRCYDGRCYRAVSLEVCVSVLGNILVDMGVSPTDVRRMGDMPFSVVIERTFPPSGLIAFRDGVLHLSFRRFYDGFSRERIVTEVLDYPYSPDASCGLWQRFLCEVMPDEASRMCLQEFFGMVYLDRDRLSVEKFALFVGAGANGKSVIFEVMKRVLGADNVSTLDPVQLSDEKMLPYVAGKRLNFSPDLARSKDFGSALKALASGQDVTGRRIYGDPEKVKCPPLCFALNEMPRLRDVTPAFFRRVLLFSFDVRIPPERQDKGLVSKICASDLPGVFNWVLDGRDRLVAQGGEFTYSQKMSDDLEALKEGLFHASDCPVRAYLASRGLSVHPVRPGQVPVLISQEEILVAMGGLVTRTAITRELRDFGVESVRSKEMKYKVYKI